MSETVADHLLARLRDWGVDTVFGYAGDGINGLLAAWGRADDDPRFIQVRHEEMAAFAAVGYAKFSGRVGVCVATSGPGAIHLLNGLYDAKLDHVPPHATVEQMKDAALALLKGDVDRWQVLKQGIRTKAQEFLPHRDR
jgi:pyruvate dehydrogenase (quinone)